MSSSYTTLEQIFLDLNKSINEKIVGTNFLELIKFLLIEKLNNLTENDLKNLKLMPLNGKILEKNINLSNRKIAYKIEYFDKSVSIIKQKTEKDYLNIMLEGFKSITIYDNADHKKSIFSNLSKNMGIVLSSNTVITTKIAAKSILLSISND